MCPLNIQHVLTNIDDHSKVLSEYEDANQEEETELESRDCCLSEGMVDEHRVVTKGKKSRIDTPPKEIRNIDKKRNKMTYTT